uniref:Uncharacterized protein n=1 Tax=Acrobeloides nanus TaxID=290746 RepID=A0A914D6V7_9BILA
MAFQVIYDSKRSGHFIILEWTPEERTVVVYNSLVPTMESIENTLTNTVRSQIIAILVIYTRVRRFPSELSGTFHSNETTGPAVYKVELNKTTVKIDSSWNEDNGSNKHATGSHSA